MCSTTIRRVCNFIQSSLAILVVSGCTSVDTIEEYSGTESLLRPKVVVVKNFAYSPEHIKLNRGLFAKLERNFEHNDPTGQELLLGKKVSSALGMKLVAKLQDLGLNARRFDEASLPVGDYLLIDGQLTSIDQGNRAERLLIGLGFGKTVVKTWCQVYDVSSSGRTLTQEFDTVAHSAYKPGAAETMGVGAVAGSVATVAAISAAGDVASETLGANVEADAERTATELVDKIRPFFVKQGWIETRYSTDKARGPAK